MDAFLRKHLGKLPPLLPWSVSAALTLALMAGIAQWIGTPGLRTGFSGNGSYHMYLTDQVSNALDGILSVERLYWISDDALAAPVPNPEGYGTAQTEEELEALEEAFSQRTQDDLVFSPDTPRMPGSTVQYYLDETIAAVTWKQVIDNGVYTFSEIKIQHPSQFRRFLAGGSFGSDKLYITTEMAQSVNAVVASSGDFYSYRQAGTLVFDGKVRRVTNGLVDTCYIDRSGDLHFSRREDDRDEAAAQTYTDENNIRFSLAFGPVLIENGEIDLPNYYVIGEINDHFPRSALCQLGQLHYLLAVVNGEGSYPDVPTLRRFGENLKAMGVQTAYTLDGGQTAVIAMNGKLINAVLFGYQRRISDIIYFATAIPDKVR